MAWFFTDKMIHGDEYVFTGEDANHITKALRMSVGERLCLCDKNCVEYDCTVKSITKSQVTVKIHSKKQCENEPDVHVTLYQSLTKGDKMEMIIQKAVELGVSEITPVLTRRCISRPDEKGMGKKLVRWQKIALQAAMQSRRGIIPKVNELLSFENALNDSQKNDCTLIFYEGGGDSIASVIDKSHKSVGIIIGSEGGFDDDEVTLALQNGAKCATLGNRILRAETAPLAAVAVIMFLTGNLG